MKITLLCVLGLVAVVTAKMDYPEPDTTKPHPTKPHKPRYHKPEDLECCCAGCGDPSLVSYDGAMLLISGQPTKTMLSGWGAHSDEGIADKCKFGLRAVTKDDIAGLTVPLHYDWVGFGFGQKAVASKNLRNALMGQDENCNVVMAVRGEGSSGVQVVSLPYEETHDGCTWKFEKKNDHLLTLRSNCCEYAFNWRPNCIDTCWEMFVGSYYQDGNLTGMCADCNGNNEDDFRMCPTGPVLPTPPFPFDTIKDSCSNAEHTGLLFPGGQRLPA